MKQGNLPEFSANEKIMTKVENVLRTRSIKSLELARRQIQNLKIESPKACQAIKLYAENWDDITHPGILSLACEAVGGTNEEAVPLQVATLLLTATMDLHDDVIDQSKTKNGRPTVFGRFGKDITILIGDAFFLEGFSFLIKNEAKIPSETLRRITGAIEQAYFEVGNAHLFEAGLRGKTNVSPDRYLRLIRKKAWNIAVHAQIGAILGGGTAKEIQIMTNYGKTLGTLITLREEYIDLFEPEELLNRMKNECPPLPLLYAFKKAGLKKKLLDIMAKPKGSKKDASPLLEALADAKVIEQFRKRMQRLSVNALNIASTIKNEKARAQMSLLVSGVLEDI
jgi:heptaprenyl diphosphate synthase